MRVAIIAPPWVPVPPTAYGGTELMIDVLARGLDMAGHEVVLFTTGDSTCNVPKKYLLENSEGMKIGDILIEMNHSLSAYEQIGDVDVVHDHTLIGPLAGQGRVNAPIVTTNHGPFQSNTMGFWKGCTDRNVPIISISNNQASMAGPGVDVSTVIHHGLDSSRIPEGTGEGNYLACLGRMAPDKGIHTAALVAKKVGMPLLIGAKMRENLEKEYFETQIRPLLGNGVEYLGELNTKEKYDLLCGATALLNPIQWPEPFGLVMIESLACGTPVIATPMGAAPEIVTDGLNGFLCRDELALIEAVLKAPELSRKACRWEVETTFSMQRMVNDHIHFYSQVIESRNQNQLAQVGKFETRSFVNT